MIRGTKPKPSALRVMGDDKAGPFEPKPRGGAPRCPPEVKGLVARREWRRIIRVAPPGLITRLDRAILMSYCVGYGHFLEAEQTLAVEGLTLHLPNGSQKSHPALTGLKLSDYQMKTAAAELGFTPSNRTRIEIGPVDADPEDEEFGLR